MRSTLLYFTNCTNMHFCNYELYKYKFYDCAFYKYTFSDYALYNCAFYAAAKKVAWLQLGLQPESLATALASTQT